MPTKTRIFFGVVFIAAIALQGWEIYTGLKVAHVSEYLVEIIYGSLVYIIMWVSENYGRIWLSFLSRVWYRGKEIRFTAAYLINLKYGDKYLLVLGRLRHFQPVGGVYKYQAGALAFLKSVDFKEDIKFHKDEKNKDDLRIRVPAKNLTKLIAWFDKVEDRECYPWREFREELIAENLLSIEDFPWLHFEKRKSIRPGITFSEEMNCLQYQIFDVYDTALSVEQEKALEKLSLIQSEKHCFVPEEIIVSNGFDNYQKAVVCNLSQTAKYLL